MMLSDKVPGGGVVAAVVGFLIVVGSCLALLFVERAAEASGNQDARWAQEVVEVPADTVDSANDRQLVHVVGTADTGETLRDPLFGVEARALRLERHVTMYQWKQLSRRVGKTTSYYYEPGWSTSLIDSDKFREAGAHVNPRAFPHPSARFAARSATVGAFRLPPGLAAEIPATSILLSPSVLDGLSPELRSRAHLKDNAIYLGRNPGKPEVGDAKYSFRAAQPGLVSILAQQVGDTFAPHPGQEPGKMLMRLRMSRLTADSMFEAAKAERASGNAIGRGLVWFFVFGGVSLVFYGVAGAQGQQVGCGLITVAALVAAGLVAGVVLLVAVV